MPTEYPGKYRCSSTLAPLSRWSSERRGVDEMPNLGGWKTEATTTAISCVEKNIHGLVLRGSLN